MQPAILMAVTRSAAKSRGSTAKVAKSRDERAREGRFTFTAEFKRSKRKLHPKTKKEEKYKVEAFNE